MTISPEMSVLFCALVLECIGLYALLTCRHLIKVLVGLQLMSKAVVLALVVAGQLAGRAGLAQALVISVIVADTVVTAVGLALAVQVSRRFGTLDLSQLAALKG
jgi:NADH:ubiquinone oxidoreductase subunit K